MKHQRDPDQPAPALLAAYLDGEVTPTEAAAVERLLMESNTARRHLDQLRDLRAALTEPASPDGLDLAPAIRRATAAIDAGKSAPRFAWGWFGGVVATAGLAAALIGVLVVRHPRARVAVDDQTFRSKAAGQAAGPERWAGVQAYRLPAAGDPLRLGDRLPAGEGLLFSYNNLGPRPFDYLMIFAVDARGQVRWFYPAYDVGGSDPASIPIRKREALVPLGDLVRHDFAPGPLSIHAVFSMQPLRVRQVEALVTAPGGRKALAALPETVVQIVTTRVGP